MSTLTTLNTEANSIARSSIQSVINNNNLATKSEISDFITASSEDTLTNKKIVSFKNDSDATITVPSGATARTLATTDDIPSLSGYATTTTTDALDTRLQTVEARIDGANPALVFDTEDDMNTWLADDENKATLKIGQNLYIKALNVPDRWWDGTQVQQLETQKVDLTNYATLTESQTISNKTLENCSVDLSSGPLYFLEVTNNFTGTFVSICYGDGKYAALSNSGLVIYSSDAITWSSSQITHTTTLSDDWIYICYANDKFTALHMNLVVATSLDCVTWDTASFSNSFTSEEMTTCCYGNRAFVAVDNHGMIYRSSNAKSWTKTESELSINSSLYYGNGYFLHTNNESNHVGMANYTSNGLLWTWNNSNGIDWTEHDNNQIAHGDLNSMCYGNGYFVGVLADSGVCVYTTNPTGAWTASATNLLPVRNWVSIAYGNGYFVALSDDGKIAYTTDPTVTWTEMHTPRNDVFDILYFDNGSFVGVGSGRTIHTSNESPIQPLSSLLSDIIAQISGSSSSSSSSPSSSNYATLTGTEELSNKTLINPTIKMGNNTLTLPS